MDIDRWVERVRALPPPDGGLPSTRGAPVYDDPDDLTDDELAARAQPNTDWTEAIHEEPGQGVTLDELLGEIDEELGRYE